MVSKHTSPTDISQQADSAAPSAVPAERRKSAGEQERQERLNAALRENLKKRKQQARARKTSQDTPDHSS